MRIIFLMSDEIVFLKYLTARELIKMKWTITYHLNNEIN